MTPKNNFARHAPASEPAFLDLFNASIHPLGSRYLLLHPGLNEAVKFESPFRLSICLDVLPFRYRVALPAVVGAGAEVLVLLRASRRPLDHHPVNPFPFAQTESESEFRL